MDRRPSQPRAVRGATFLEVMVVIAVFGLIGSAIGPVLSDIFFRRSVDLAVSSAADAMREAQFSALTGLTPGRFGVHFETGKFVMFHGAIYSAAAPDNAVHELENGVVISEISLEGGGSDIVFSDIRGLPDKAGSVAFSGGGDLVLTVTINAAGMVDVE
jgi:Tfp pilus assembly protein FimT